MFNNIEYKSGTGESYILTAEAPDLAEDFSHKVLFSIEKKSTKSTFSYNIGISHQLWEMHWKIDPNSTDQMEKLKDIYLEKAKRLIDSGKEEYLDVTLTPVNTPKTLDEAVEKLQVKS